MVYVDDSSNVLLWTAIVTEGAILLWVVGIIDPDCILWAVSVYLTGIIIQMLNYMGQGIRAGITSGDSVFFAGMIIMFVTHTLLTGLSSAAMMFVALGAVYVLFIYFEPIALGWLLDHTGVDLPGWAFKILMGCVLSLLYKAAEYVVKWPWIGRACMLVLVSFLCASCAGVLTAHFQQHKTEIEVLTFNGSFWLMWLVYLIAVTTLYALSYRYLSHHRDKLKDQGRKLLRWFHKQSKTEKQAILQRTTETRHTHPHHLPHHQYQHLLHQHDTTTSSSSS